MLASSITLVPGEVIKIRLQSGLVKSITGCMSDILKKDGIRGFYAGYGATLVRDVPFTMLELGIYENLKSLFRLAQNRKTLSSQEELTAAAITGGVASFITTPLDLIKTKVRPVSLYYLSIIEFSLQCNLPLEASMPESEMPSEASIAREAFPPCSWALSLESPGCFHSLRSI